MQQTFDPKNPNEIIPLSFEFAALATDLSLPVITVSHAYGTADPANLSTMLIGAPQIIGTQVRQKVAGGVSGASYTVRCQADTPDGYRFVITATLPVED